MGLTSESQEPITFDQEGMMGNGMECARVLDLQRTGPQKHVLLGDDCDFCFVSLLISNSRIGIQRKMRFDCVV